VLEQILASEEALGLEGYEAELFDSGMAEDMSCGVCQLVMKDPVVVPCGHSFCS
jgi:hypothetical protein